MVQPTTKQGPKMESIGGQGATAGGGAAGRASKAGSTAAKKPKSSLKSKAIKGTIGGAILYGGAQVAQNVFGSDSVDPTDPNAVAAAAVAQYAASGGDVTTMVNNPMFQQMGLDANSFVSNFSTYQLPTTGGVYLGEQQYTMSVPKRGARTGTRQVTVSASEWERQFPIADPQKLNQFKQKLVDAGLVTPSAGIQELQTEWKRFGEFSSMAYKSGEKLTPDQIIDIQRGLWGGGSGGGPSYSLQYSSPESIKDVYSQTYTARTGKVLDQGKQDKFVRFINKLEENKPTKTETKVIKGKKVTVTTPGITGAEISAEAEKRAMQDPQYKEYQNATVFGDGLSKALGIR
jgi:hypothetical protein